MVEGLAAFLRDAGYTTEAALEATAAAEGARPEHRAAARLLALERRGDALAALVRLFKLGERGPAPPGAELLERAGLIRREGDEAVPLARIDEVDGLYIRGDASGERADATAPVSRATRMCLAFTPTLDVERALDVGAGTGALALRMARHARHVVATDVSPRALAFLRSNAELNGLAVETREGSFLEPVAGERFGLVTCNPPYVISPDSSFVYRDGGLPGDAVSRTLLAELPGVLEEDGYAVLQGNFIHAGSWWRPLAPILAGSGCDALLARITTWTPLEYALAWADRPGEAYEDTVRRWLDSYEGIEAISAAMIVLRRRTGARNWRRAVTLRRVPEGLGERLPQLFDAEFTPGMRLRRAPGLRLRGDVLELPSSPEGRRPVPPDLAAAVAALDGSPVHDPRFETLLKLGYVV